MRLTNEQKQELIEKEGVKTLWSFSRFDTYRTSHYEYFLNYVKHLKGDAPVSPYLNLGSACHDILENLYANNISTENMADSFDTSFTTEIDLLDLKFDRNDSERNKSIKKKYYENLLECFKHYQKLPYKVISEQFLKIKVNNNILFGGYADAIYKDDDGNYVIVDWKTSSKYSGKDLENHSHQLVLYSEGLHQKGIPTDKIKCCFCFLKYVRLYQMQANGKWKDSIIERRDIGKKVQNKAKMWLKKSSLDEKEIDELLNESLVSNTIDNLPDEVRNKFRIEDAYVYIDNWYDIWQELKVEIIETIEEIENKTAEYKITDDEHIWWDDDETLKREGFYFSNLSDYSINQLKPYKEYLEKIKAEQEYANDLLGVSASKSEEKNDNDDEDFSWLEDI